jgi:HD-GYP domain-containing protein (c-di-GMP phosphodiesterase class II)
LVGVVAASAGSAGDAGLLALGPLALGAALALDAVRRLARRVTKLEADAARVVSGRAAAQVPLETMRAAGARDAEQQRREHQRLERALRRAEQTTHQQSELLRRLERSRRAEREWNRELRAQLQRLYESPRGATRDADVGTLILEAALQLVEAEKGMLLLARNDGDGHGDDALDVAVSRGFEHDPADSAVGRRFARKVLALDEIVREDEPERDAGAETPADQEIEGLVAIPVYLKDTFHGVIVCANRPGGFEEVDDDVLLALGDQAGAVLHHGQLRTEVQDARRGTVRALVEALAAHDPKRHLHSTRLATHAQALARDLELDDWWTHVLVTATLLRDVGHLALPAQLLAAPRPLTPEERALVELHPRVGFTIIGQAPALRDVAGAVLYHHERFDGAGYPAALAGEHIPRAARALAVLDAYGAITSERPYRRRRSPEEACVELVAAAGTQFDPEIAQLFVEHVRQGRADAAAEPADAVEDGLPLDVLADGASVPEPLTVATTDGLTLLGNRRALEQDLRDAPHGAAGETPLALLLVQLEDVPHVNERVGYAAGDRIIQLAARHAQRTAVRFGGRAYRSSGRRLAVVAPLRVGEDGSGVVTSLGHEFAAGPAVRTALCVLRPGEVAAGVLERARRVLDDAP